MDNVNATDCMGFKGCGLRFRPGIVGISEKLVAFAGDDAVAVASDLSRRSREALADGMIGLWTRFRRGEVHPEVAARKKKTDRYVQELRREMA